MPLMLAAVYILGVYDLVRSKSSAMFITGFLAAAVATINMNGTFPVILLNVIPYFVTFFALSFIYHKNQYNIWFSGVTLVIYTMFAGLLIERIS